jgi:hypothetical protein
MAGVDVARTAAAPAAAAGFIKISAAAAAEITAAAAAAAPISDSASSGAPRELGANLTATGASCATCCRGAASALSIVTVLGGTI